MDLPLFWSLSQKEEAVYFKKQMGSLTFFSKQKKKQKNQMG